MEKFSPTLIIGLGGMGSRIVEGVYRNFMAGDPNGLEKANAAFLCLDTDENDIKKRRKIMPPDNVVKTSSDLSTTIGHYINRIERRTSVKKWFDTRSFELNTMPLNSGAAQVRMASRLAMMSAINEGKFAPIDNAITQLMSTNPARKKGNDIKIHIISSLAGGTGAGTFLQVAYYVKNAMREHGAEAPRVNGYFILADVLCDDSNCGLDQTQKENTRSNTYACIKELIAFSSSDRDSGLKKIEFEYKLGQRDKGLPADAPYNVYYMIDYNGADGGNLTKHDRYYDQLISYVFLNAFSDVGDNYRQLAINQIRQQIESDGKKKFASIGVSKLIYPVDDLFAYFARQRVADNLSDTWCIIDKLIQERFDEYKKNVFNGIPDTQPDKGVEFMRHVENFKDGAGNIAAQFKQIYNSTQILNEDLTPITPKSREFVNRIKEFVERTVDTRKELTGLYDQCTVPNSDFVKRDSGDKDLSFVVRRERELEDYRKAVMAFIDGSKQWVVRECLLVDHETEDYVSKTPEAHRHHLNTFILKKDEEMHPIAVRYFLYDVKKNLEKKLNGKEGLRESNKRLKKQIEDEYKTAFDITETKNKKETAQDSLTLAKRKNSGFNIVTNFVSGQDPYKSAKENYVSRSTQQAEDIHTYATEKMLEEAYSGLLDQINRLIEESENFFENLPAAILSLDNERLALFTKHNVDNADPSIEYVLASEQHKKDIYDYVISRNDSPFFPTKMSASVYRTMFHHVCNELNTSGFVTSKKKSKKEIKAETIEANKVIIKECIAFQDEIIRESNPRYANMNVIEALLEEGKRENDNDDTKAWEYAKQKFHNFRDRAEIFGPNNLDSEVRFINAWGLHPDCVDISTIPSAKADELFGDTAVDTNPKNAATRLVSKFFNKHEIVRANTVTLLSIDKYFNKFLSKEKTESTDESYGCYYVAYQDVITKMRQPNSKTFTPHLDKYWHLPSYMPYIGSSMAEEKKKLFRALYGGLLFDKFKAVYDGGEYYWTYLGKTCQYIKDIDGIRVTIGQSQESALNNLFEKGLANNPDIVNQVNDFVEGQWEKEKEKWLGAERDESNELQLMKDSDIVRTISDYKYNIHNSFKKNQNWFTLLNSRQGLVLFNTIKEQKEFFFIDLMNHLIDIFGPCVNTKKLCAYILKKAGTKFKNDTTCILDNFEDEGRFEPKD